MAPRDPATYIDIHHPLTRIVQYLLLYVLLGGEDGRESGGVLL